MFRPPHILDVLQRIDGCVVKGAELLREGLITGGRCVLGKIRDDSLCVKVDRHVLPGPRSDRIRPPEALEPVGLSVSNEGVVERRAEDDLQLGEGVGALSFGRTE